VRFLGYLDDFELPAIYSGAEGFVFPSLYEGFGIPVVEAMSCGTPVVTANTTSLPEVCGDAAVFVNPEDVDSIADGMRQIVEDDRLRATLRQRGLQQSSRFTWERAAELTWNVLERIRLE
jgi:glycosyltransferase involved in cell wall biosynthesis